jgi:hypothetical protein
MALSRVAKLLLALPICAAFPALTPFAGAKPKGAETFRGTCEMSGVIRHEPPLTQTPTPTIVRGSFRGLCSGQVTDRKGRTRRLDEAPASYRALGAGPLSCLSGVATGTGKLSLGRGSVIEFALTERRGPGVAEVTLEGESGGTATVFGTVSRDQDLIELNRRCMSSGVRLLRGDARIVSPGIAG